MSPPPPRGARQRALLTVERLRDLYPAVTELAHQDPFQLVIATILSAQTTDRSVNLVTPELFQRFPAAADLAAADPAEVEDLIKPTGFFRLKTRRIIDASQKMVELFGGEVPGNLDDLVKIPGIGRKTANVVLNIAFGEPTIAVDTHIFRVGNRTGLAVGKTPLDVEMKLMAAVPEQYRLHAHHWLILHGRYVCVARRPLCEKCVIADLCKWPGKAVNSPVQIENANK